MPDCRDQRFEDDSQWYDTESLIAHALGGNIRKEHTNSKEAVKQAISDGFRVFEVDLRVTSDLRLVCAHDWPDGQAMSYEEFIGTKIDGRFTPMDIEECLELLDRDGFSLIIDIKNENEFETVCKLLKQARRMHCDLVIQIGNERDFEFAAYANVLYNLTNHEDYERVSAFCMAKGIRAVSIYEKRLLAGDSWKILTEHNIKVFAFTVNSLKEYRELKEQGVSGVFTDFLIPADVN